MKNTTSTEERNRILVPGEHHRNALNAVIALATCFGSLIAGLGILPRSKPSESALILCISITLSGTVFMGIGAWESIRRFRWMAAFGSLSIVFLAVLSIAAQGSATASQKGASGTIPPSASPVISSPPYSSPSTSTPASASSATPSTTPTPAETAALGPRSLLNMTPSYDTDGNDDFGTGSEEVDGSMYQHTLYDTSGEFDCDGTTADSATYQLDHKYREFHTVVGLADSSGNGDSVKFTFQVDGQQGGQTPTLFPGETVPINIPLAHAFRIVLQETCNSPNNNGNVTAVWINPTVAR